MKIIGLAGGIASGKNFVAEIFRQTGAAVFDADEEVHKLLQFDKTVIRAIKKFSPESFIDKKVNRKNLAELVFNNPAKLKILETILHPGVRKKYCEFLQNSQKENKKIVVLNIPLLLENNFYKCDKIIALIIPFAVQKNRFLARAKKADPKNFLCNKKFFEKRFEQIKSIQISDLERKRRADFIVNSGLSKAATMRQIQKIILQLH
jgi:dephospho-CoA kinase